jgi:hypothetical protein
MSLKHGCLLHQLFGHLNVSDSLVFFSHGGGSGGSSDDNMKGGEDSARRQNVFSDLSKVYSTLSLS